MLNNMQPKVSIIVPCWGVEQYLDRCVESLVSQTLRDIEIILVDDESPDRVPEMCDAWVATDSRIKVVHKKNEGLGMACNSGMAMATGEFLAFCDSDDWVEPIMYEDLYEAARTNDADAVFSGIRTVNDNGVVSPMNEPESYRVLKSKEDVNALALEIIGSEPSCSKERLMAMSAKIVLYKRQMIEKHSLKFVSEREIICEDLIWNMDVLAHANVVVTLPKTWYNYYSGSGDTLSRKLRTDRFGYFKTMREAVFKRCVEYCYPVIYKQRCDRMFIGYTRFYLRQIIKSDLPNAEKKELISTICTDDIWKEVWKSYPIGKMPLKHKVMAVLMKYNFYSGIKIACSI